MECASAQCFHVVNIKNTFIEIPEENGIVENCSISIGSQAARSASAPPRTNGGRHVSSYAVQGSKASQRAPLTPWADRDDAEDRMRRGEVERKELPGIAVTTATAAARGQRLSVPMLDETADFVGLHFLRVGAASQSWLRTARSKRTMWMLDPQALYCECSKKSRCRYGAGCNRGNNKCKYCHCFEPRAGAANRRHNRNRPMGIR
mmetsp:Transcript_15731/g.42971  ORF Transcript_15731/g.42971 Transcript_15731/m.42971 type:complete len:205 (-) Transcript_15731:212-826(-)